MPLCENVDVFDSYTVETVKCAFGKYKIREKYAQSIDIRYKIKSK